MEADNLLCIFHTKIKVKQPENFMGHYWVLSLTVLVKTNRLVNK